MRIVWTLFKVIVALAVAIPIGLFALALAAGLVGTIIGLAIAVLRVAVFGATAYGLYRLGRLVFGRSPKAAAPPAALAPADPYYEAAMRELDAELRVPIGR